MHISTENQEKILALNTGQGILQLLIYNVLATCFSAYIILYTWKSGF